MISHRFGVSPTLLADGAGLAQVSAYEHGRGIAGGSIRHTAMATEPRVEVSSEGRGGECDTVDLKCWKTLNQSPVASVISLVTPLLLGAYSVGEDDRLAGAASAVRWT